MAARTLWFALLAVPLTLTGCVSSQYMHVGTSSFQPRQSGYIIDVYAYPTDALFTPLQAYQRLLSRLGERRYEAVNNSCESLIHWAIYGEDFIPQGKALGELALAVTALVAVAKAA